MTDWKPVATALLGSWPNQVATWDREGISAYLAELEARGLTPDEALVAIRSCDGDQRFPPSAPELAALARQDASLPTFEEAVQMIFGTGGALRARISGQEFYDEAEMLRARDRAADERADQIHPLVGSFVRRYGVGRLRMVDLDDRQYGLVRRRELRAAWDQHCEAMQGRELTAIAQGRRGSLGKLDPLAAINGDRPQIERGD